MDNKHHQKTHTDKFKKEGGRIIQVRLPAPQVTKLLLISNTWGLSINATMKRLIALVDIAVKK